MKKSISEINYTPQKSNPWLIKLYMNDGYIVTASLKTFGQKMNSYPAIVKELPKGEKGIIHMEVATNKIAISIEEYKSIAFLQKHNVYYSVLENGTVLPEEVTPTDIGPTLNNWEEDEKLVQMAKQLNKLSEYLQTPISKVSKVEIKGNKNVSKEQIISLSSIHKGQTEFWSLSKQKAAEKIEQNKLIKKAEISKQLPQK
ncbi:hypothetical protein DT075_23685 [Bacillus licheniformis]|nr:hypothetical protein DT075_23685 [Bacillus licheniformis]